MRGVAGICSTPHFSDSPVVCPENLCYDKEKPAAGGCSMSEMDALFQKFQSASREDVRLELALEGYFSGLADETQKQALESYLRRRLRSAMELLLREGRTEELEQLLNQGWLTAGLLEDGLSLAISLKSTEGFVLLLRRKAELVGFSDRDFSL
jgi:hypothetical protein